MSEEISFETALQELDKIVGQLEDGQLSLEESLSLYERGQKLSNYCQQILEKATLRVEQLTQDGEIVEISGE